MKRIIWILLLIISLQLVTAETYYSVDLNSMDGNIMYSSVIISTQNYGLETTMDGHKALMYDYDSQLIFEKKFTPPNFGPFSLTLPYLKTVKEIVIKDETDSQKLKFSVNHFSNYCGNGVCNLDEDLNSCSLDCKKKIKKKESIEKINNPGNKNNEIAKDKEDENSEKIITKPIPTPPKDEIEKDPIKDKKENKKEINESKTSKIIYVVSGLFFLIIITVLVLLVLSKKKKVDSPQKIQLRDYIKNCLNQGYNIQQIKVYLINSGYDQNLVDEIIQELNN